MKANNIGEVSTSIGTGNFTTTGVYRHCGSFSSWFGLNHRFEYVIRNDNGEWEKGLGYMTSATTMVRETPIDNHNRTPTLVNFSAGNKVILCATDAGEGIVPINRTDSPTVSLHSVGASAATIALVANRPRLSAFWLNRPFQCAEIGLRVTTASAGSSTRIALYQLVGASSSGYSFALLDDVGTVDSATTGEKNLTYARKLGAGVYYTAAISTATPTVQAYPAGTGEVGVSILNGTATGSHFDAGVMSGSSATAPLTVLIANPSANSTSPRIHLKGAYV